MMLGALIVMFCFVALPLWGVIGLLLAVGRAPRVDRPPQPSSGSNGQWACAQGHPLPLQHIAMQPSEREGFLEPVLHQE